LRTACLTIVVLFGFVALTCDEDCPVCPKEPEPTEKEYHFLYSFIGSFYTSAVLTYSTKTGEVVDSTYYGRHPFWDARFTSDGRYACYTSSDYGWATTWMTEYATGDTVSVLQGIAGYFLSISHDDKYLLMNNYFVGPPAGFLFRVPTLAIVQEFQTIDWLGIDTHPSKNIGVAGLFYQDSLLFIDFTTDTVSTRKVRIDLLNGEGLYVSGVKYSRDGSKLILWGAIPGNTIIQVRDAETLETLHESWVDVRLGPYVHPDGERVFFCKPWIDMGAYPSAVWELNMRTHLFRKILDGSDFHGRGLDPSDMDITPDGKYAFFISGGEGLDHGPILKFDLDTYQFVDAFFPPAGFSRVIRMYPLEIKK
jgi:hypothetical protein